MADRGLWGLRYALSKACLPLALAVLSVALCACGRGVPEFATGAVPLSGPVRLTADWLSRQPGPDIGEFHFRLLSAAGEPLASWRGIDIVQAAPGRAGFELNISTSAPDDVYLYVVYPGDRFSFESAELASERAGGYLSLTVARQIANVVVLGVSRIGTQRASAATPGLLAQLSFRAGRELPLRESSLVNTDNASAPELLLSTAAGGGIKLDWDERNIGDYDNNSQVGISDITPVGIHYGKTLLGSPEFPELQLVDGDANLLISIGDLTPIGRNFGRFIQGFSVYYATVANPLPADFSALAKPTVQRQSVWDAATPQERKRRLHYIFEPPSQNGPNHYYVRAYSNDGGEESEGPASNTASRVIVPANEPPAWITAAGLLSAGGVGDGISLSFSDAVDPEGDPLVYSLSYVQTPGVIGDPGTATLDLPPAVTAGTPPFQYHMGPLAPGIAYELAVEVRDAFHDPIPGNVLQATVPAAGGPGLWPQPRYDTARTGTNSEAVLSAPFSQAWAAPLAGNLGFSTQSTPVISGANWLGVFDTTGEFIRLDAITGTLLATHPAPPAPAVLTDGVYPTLLGNLLAVGVTTGVAVYDIATSVAPTVYAGASAVATAPLLGSNEVIALETSGVLRATLLGSGIEHWQAQLSATEAYHISPCADVSYIYACSDTGALAKVSLADGAIVQTGSLPAIPHGNALALDAAQGLLYIATQEDRLIEISTATLAVTRRFPLALDEQPPCAPCLVLHATPPLALVGMPVQSMIEAPGRVVALNLDDGTEAWQYATDFLDNPFHITAGAELAVASGGNHAYVLDFAGRIRQRIDNGGSFFGDMAIGNGCLVSLKANELRLYQPVAVDNPPVWEDVVGIKRLTRTANQMTVEWEYALDAEGQPTYYVIYYAEDALPSFAAPYPGTTLITDIPAGGEGINSFTSSHSHTITGLNPAADYYAAVRAYDAPWEAAPQLDANKNILKAVPAWQREELVLGTDLPDGEIFFMRGLVDPGGTMHLVYNDTNTGNLWHIYGTTGSWAQDGAGLDALPAVAGFEPAWDGDNNRLAIAYATADSVGLARRTGVDAWSIEDWDTALPVTNPQVSLALGPGMALAYTHYISGAFPVITEHYYLRREIDGTLGGFEPLDELNYCGRDLDLVLNPLDANDPWVAFQRGTEAVPGRLTPEKGVLLYSRANGGGGFDLEQVDAGIAAPDADCGKRVQQVLDTAGKAHLAYYDLHASNVETLGQLKYATDASGAWQIETLDSFHQPATPLQLQYTYSELGFGLTADARPVIAQLYRLTVADDTNDPHLADVRVWWRGLDGSWSLERMLDGATVFLRDREPCVLLITPDGTWHVFYVTFSDGANAGADKIVHMYTPGR